VPEGGLYCKKNGQTLITGQKKPNSPKILPRKSEMRKPLIFLLIATSLLPAGTGLAQAPTSIEEMRLRELAKEKEVQQEELVNLETETARAIQWNTGTFFRRVYGDDFVAILPSGQILNKMGWIASVERSDAKYESFIASDIKVRMFEETAVVTCMWTSRGTRNGRPFAKQSRVTHVYVYGQRGWQAISSQETLLPG
jgi:hypothetical protein